MIRTKLGLLGLCAVVFGVMAMSATSAQAALSWLVLNSAKTTETELKAELAGESDGDVSLTTKEVSIKFTVTCSGFELVGVNLEAGGTLTNGGKVKFTGCEAYETAPLTGALGCHVHSAGQTSGNVLTAEGKGTLALHTLTGGGTEVLTKLEPSVGTTFATFLTEKCVVPETNPVNGVLYLKDCEKQTEGPCVNKSLTYAVKHLVEQGPLTSLWVGSDTAEHLETSLSGGGWIKLGGAHAGLFWRAMDV